MAGLTDEITALMSRWEAPLLGYAGRLLRSEHLAQDVVQETFIRYLEQRRQGERIDNARAWLYRVAHNLALDYIRRNRRGEAARDEIRESMVGASADGPDRHVARRDAEATAFAMLETLSEREQQLVLLKVVEEKSYKEMAEIMGLSVGNVGFILHTAMKKLARQMRDVLG